MQPAGRGPLNPRGVDFYDRLVDGLLERGIQPWASLYHWDLPQVLEDAGGWPERDTAYRLAEYAALIYEALGDRVTGWITINEPWCVSFLGYAAGVHAPGRQDDVAAVHAAHHALLAHGLAVDALRAQGATNVGITTNLYHVMAASDSEADLDAARRVDGLQNRFFLDPGAARFLPGRRDRGPGGGDRLRARAGRRSRADRGADRLPRRSTTTAATGSPRQAATGGRPTRRRRRREPTARDGRRGWGREDVVFRSSGLPLTAMGWEVDSDGLRQVLVRVAREYDAPPIYVTENGAAYADVLRDGDVDDPERIAYVNGHLAACAAAIAEGADLRGYFLWSLLDNFEWSWGYTRRFGIVHVDYATQVRTPKASARWYRQLMAGD